MHVFCNILVPNCYLFDYFDVKRNVRGNVPTVNRIVKRKEKQYFDKKPNIDYLFVFNIIFCIKTVRKALEIKFQLLFNFCF